MKLEKHMVDTLKEWQLKLGSGNDRICLYYPRDSICEYLGIEENMDWNALICAVRQYLDKHASYLGKVRFTHSDDRLCMEVPEEGCDYVEKHVKAPDFLQKFLLVLKEQNMEKIKSLFHEYAEQNHGTVVEETETDDMGTVLYFQQ